MSLSAVIATLTDPAITRRPIFDKDIKQHVDPLTSFIREQDFPTISAADVLCLESKPVAWHDCTTAGTAVQSLKGKVVLIGDDTASERFSTPAGEMPGVYLHANYVESLLDDRYFKKAPLWSEILMSFLWILALEFVFGRYESRPALYLLAWFLAGIILLLGVSWVAFQWRGLFIMFGLPAAVIALPARFLDRIREETAV